MGNYDVINLEEVNKDGNNDILAISIKVKNMESKDKKKFKSVKASMYLECFKRNDDGDLVSIGYKNRWIDLSFTRDAFNTDCFEGCIVKGISNLSTGTLYVNANYVDAPNSYKVTQDEDGEDVYPKIWVRGGIVGFQKYKPSQDKFNYHKPSNDVIDVEVDDASGEITEITEVE